MKKILLFELCLLFLATNFQSDNPPGWYQQFMPVNDLVNDIFFIDSLNGWVVTQGATSGTDTGYIMKTTNGGDNWYLQFTGIVNFNAIQFLDLNTGYAGGGDGFPKLYRTSNGGSNWNIVPIASGVRISDMYFTNGETGWVCDDTPTFGAGLLKTTNGGLNWTQQLNNSFRPYRLNFINSDTGWVTGTDGKLHRTTNGGANWNLQYTFPGNPQDIYFWNGLRGVASTASYTTDGGFTWMQSEGNVGGSEVSFANDSVGWSGSNFFNIAKTFDGGMNWGYQTSPQFNNLSVSSYDSLKAWAGGNRVVHTTDGGGPVTNIQQISNEITSDFILDQNYPNPFNPFTSIKFKVKSLKSIKLAVLDITGKELAVLVNKKLNPGEYEYTFEAGHLPSGVYFYNLFADGVRVDTKKMVLLK